MKIRLSKRDGLYIGQVGLDVEALPGRITTTAVGETKAVAIAKAASVAERIASDPALRRAVPPQVLHALQVTKGLAAAARRGLPTLRRAWHLLSPKSRDLARHLATDIAERKRIGDVGDEELGFAPIALLAASLAKKYGPTVGKKLLAIARKRGPGIARKIARKFVKKKKREERAAKEAEAEADNEDQDQDQDQDQDGGSDAE